MCSGATICEWLERSGAEEPVVAIIRIGWSILVGSINVLASTMAVSSLGVAATDQAREPVTVDWLQGSAAAQASTVPEFAWLSTGDLMLYEDAAGPHSKIERLNPVTGRRRDAVDTNVALTSLRTYLGDGTPETLPWPDGFDADGRYGLYSFGGQIFLLEISTSRFRRLTNAADASEGARWSPDGSKIAFVRTNNLWIYDLRANAERQLTTDGSGSILNGTLSFEYGEDIFNGETHGVWWSGDSQAIAYLRTDVSHVGTLNLIDNEPFHPRLIPERYPLAGEEIETVRVGIVNVGTGGTIWVSDTGLADQYVTHVDWLPGTGGLSVQIQNRAQDRTDLYIVDRATGHGRSVLQERDAAWVNVSDDLYFLERTHRFIWGSERDGHKHLYLYDLQGHCLRQLTQGAWSVRGPTQVIYWWGKAVVSIDETRGWIYFTSLQKSSIERHLYRMKLDGSGLQRITTEDGFHSIVFSSNGRYYLDRYSRASRLPSLVLHRADGSVLQVIQPPRKDLIADREISYPKFFRIPALDGFPMPAQILMPPHFDPSRRYPVIVHHYGGPQAPLVIDRWQNALFFDQILLSKGFVVFSFDNRSASAISATAEKTILRDVFGRQEHDDLLAAVSWLKSQPWVDPGRLGIWGWSYGGGFTLLAMTGTTDFKAGIAVAGPADNRFNEARWAEFAMKRPQEDWDAYERVSFLRKAANLHGRLLLIHGTFDDNVRVQNTMALAAALIAAGKPFDMALYPGREHLISDPPARRHLLEKMLEFWQRNL